MDKTCPQCQTEFQVTKDAFEFYDTISPVFGDKKCQIPPPTMCPDCRMQRRLAFRHERGLHHRKCDATGEQIISMYHAKKPYQVYKPDHWWSDKWNALDYGREYDFERPFFDQFKDLWQQVPLIALWLIDCENSDYNTNSFQIKDSYMCANSDFGQNYLYCHSAENSKDLTDCAYIHKSELCYEACDCLNSYHCTFSRELQNCSDCHFSTELIGCKNCFGCHGLRQKEYCLYNEEVGKAAWEKHMKGFVWNWPNIEEAKKKTRDIELKVPKPALHMYQCEDSIGDHLYNCKNVKHCFDVVDAENMTYGAYNVLDAKNFHDYYAAGGVQWTYEYTGGGLNVDHVAFMLNCASGINNSYYCVLCVNSSHHLFGCVSCNKNEYCILNKQYTEGEYNDLMPKIVEHMQSTGEWGQSFDPKISPFGYNEVLAIEEFPLSKAEALKQGFNWSDVPIEAPTADKVIPAERLPALIEDVPDDILNWAITCPVTKKPFQIQSQELKFYRQMNLPIPHLHPDERHRLRMALRNPRHLWNRKCDKCQKEIQTTYQPSRPEIVYCEECYQKTVY